MKAARIRFLVTVACICLIIAQLAEADVVYSNRYFIKNRIKYVEQKWTCFPTNPLSKNSGRIDTTKTFAQHSAGDAGLDIRIKGSNISVCASLSGKVTSVVKSNVGYGNHVVVETQVGTSKLVIYYCHLANNSIAVKKGQQISEGKLIGTMGSTGNSTGPHLHFEVRYDGKRIDPASFLNNKLTKTVVTPVF